MELRLGNENVEMPLMWKRNPDGSWVASRKHSYKLFQHDQFQQKWLASVDGKRVLQTDPDHAGEALQFWYLEDAKEHCYEVECGREGFTKSTFGPRKPL